MRALPHVALPHVALSKAVRCLGGVSESVIEWARDRNGVMNDPNKSESDDDCIEFTA